MPVFERAVHYMQKEIFEQPQALGNTLEMLGGGWRLQLGIFGADAAVVFAEVDSERTAHHWIEQLSGLLCNVPESAIVRETAMRLACSRS